MLYDLAIETVYPLANPTEGEKMAIVAVGGYGRGELAPYSDIDLLFLLPYKRTPHNEQVIEFLLYLLWDLGLKVGQATRSVAECLRYARDDLTVRTALLEARYIWGEQALFGELKQAFETEIQRGTAAQFVEAKLAERDARHVRVGDSRYQLEPNIKEGKGGLRDLHTLFWIAKYIYRIDDVAQARRTRRALGRGIGALPAGAELSVDRALPPALPRRPRRGAADLRHAARDRRPYGLRRPAGVRGVERFMKHYFLVAKDVGDLTRIFCAVLETEQQRKRRVSWLRWGRTIYGAGARSAASRSKASG